MLIVKRKFFFILILTFLNCYSRIDLCDDFDFEIKECTNYPQNIEIEVKKNQTLKDLSNDLYFHNKVTLGIIFKQYQLINFKVDTFECNYTVHSNNNHFKKISHHFEGNRWINNDLWCFDYLGSMIYNFYHFNNINHKFIKELDNDTLNLIIELSISKNNTIQKNFIRLITIKNLY